MFRLYRLYLSVNIEFQTDTKDSKALSRTPHLYVYQPSVLHCHKFPRLPKNNLDMQFKKSFLRCPLQVASLKPSIGPGNCLAWADTKPLLLIAQNIKLFKVFKPQSINLKTTQIMNGNDLEDYKETLNALLKPATFKTTKKTKDKKTSLCM